MYTLIQGIVYIYTNNCMEYRINKQRLLDTISTWNEFLGRKVHLIACGGTAMTLLGVKESTKDIDLVVPEEKEYDYLIKVLGEIGYKPVTGSGWARDKEFIFELFRGKRVHTTELLESPLLEDNNILVKEFSNIYLGALNYYDLIISKLFRGNTVDVQDCLGLIKAKRKEINISHLAERFRETASFDVSEDRVKINLEHFMKTIKKEGLLNEE